jgi:FlaA1/EpsC-like NDP-sugar epimerase
MIDGGHPVQERCCEVATTHGWTIRRWLRALHAILQQGYGSGLAVPAHVLVLALDAIGTAMALQLAFWLQSDGAVPARQVGAVAAVLPALLVARLVCNVAAGIHRWSFRQAGLADALRVGTAGLAGTLVLAFVAPGLIHGIVPRAVYVLEFFLATSYFGLLRFGPRAGCRWLGKRANKRAGAPRTIIVGAGDTAELLARDVQRNRQSRYSLVGFVSEDPRMVGCRLDGHRVLGVVSDLPDLVRRHRVRMVLLADPSLAASRVRQILDLCASCRVRFKIIPAALEQIERLSAAMLEDVSPEDLLPRDSIAFDEAEIRALVRGRRALVTGAAGSIGSELCRQLARHGVRQLVMVDMNENELYLGSRALSEQFPDVDVRTEIADVREAEPLRRLGERHRPQDVFHAAAHKHVPLMEEAPEEAVKNNVFGTINVARMADRCGAERFVLISTDKAVNPTSVMGATKRVAELIVRDLCRSSRTRMTAVRFGNVLGSAGSVVPLFKQQIARRGPVTVTHPDCTRYFMTIPEAVGLVLLAGLGGYGDLCILEMGEPVRIAELAKNLITLAGLVPEEDIPIVYTGLRPGEKLNEELLTEQEEQTQAVRNRICVARSPLPPPDLATRLAELRRIADEGDREGVLEALREIVPTFQATPRSAPVAVLRPQAPHRESSLVVDLRPAACEAAAG